MRWLITGARGQLGSDLVAELAGTADEVHAVGSAEVDITDAAAVDAVVARIGPDVVVNAAAYTAVDAAETDEERAHLVNAAGPAHLAVALAHHGGRLLQVSTDYVFAGDATEPYPVDAPTAPRSAYGRTKRDGELAVRELLPDAGYVVRTAWLYSATGANFVKTMVRLEGSRDTLDVVDDQRGSPTWSRDLAHGLVALGRSSAPAGIYHCTNAEQTTWFGFTRAIFEELGADPDRVQPTDSASLLRPAPRPAYSVLSASEWEAAGLPPMPSWRDALHEAFARHADALRAS